MAVFDPMAFAPVKVSKQWSIEGGRLTTPYGLDVKEIESTGGALSFDRIDKNVDWLLKTMAGKTVKGCLRRSTLFNTLETKIPKTLLVEPRARPRELALLRSRGHVLSHSCGHVLSRSRGA